jgi:hypothetical protein
MFLCYNAGIQAGFNALVKGEEMAIIIRCLLAFSLCGLVGLAQPPSDKMGPPAPFDALKRASNRSILYQMLARTTLDSTGDIKFKLGSGQHVQTQIDTLIKPRPAGYWSATGEQTPEKLTEDYRIPLGRLFNKLHINNQVEGFLYEEKKSPSNSSLTAIP